jgi:hypothetical protein
VLHLLAGVFVTYQGLVALLNTTTIRFDRAAFRLRRGPIPQKGNIELPADAVEWFGVVDAGTPKRSAGASTFARRTRGASR